MSVFSMDEDKNHRLVQQSTETIEKLYVKYQDDVYMVSKIHHYIANQLPILLENINESREKSKQRNTEHQDIQDKFTQQYLNQYKYYYNPSNELYFWYNGVNYTNIMEDHVLHHIVSTISQQQNPTLMNWKHKTKVSLLKKIKDQHIAKSIPESETIQMVLNRIYPSMFSTKTEAKHFLTVLGDNILKKDSHLIYFIESYSKNLLRTLNTKSMECFNVQCIQTFKYKYHEKQNEKDSRLINILSTVKNSAWCDETISYCALDILCVACHYSNKYKCADDYINDFSQDMELQNYVFHLKTHSPQEIVSQFTKEYLFNLKEHEKDIVSVSPQEEHFLQIKLLDKTESAGLSWKHMQYLWKMFLDIHHYPMGLYSGAICKKYLIENYKAQYNEQEDMFCDMGSSQIPLIQKFLKFWDETSIEDTKEYSELESEEISMLFRNWLHFDQHHKKSKYLLKENKIMDILSYFHPELEIVNEKNVMRTRNLLWDKDMDIELALSHLKENGYVNLSVYEAYNHYTKFHTNHLTENRMKPLLVSKSYFEKYIQYVYRLNNAGILFSN